MVTHEIVETLLNVGKGLLFVGYGICFLSFLIEKLLMR